VAPAQWHAAGVGEPFQPSPLANARWSPVRPAPASRPCFAPLLASGHSEWFDLDPGECVTDDAAAKALFPDWTAAYGHRLSRRTRKLQPPTGSRRFSLWSVFRSFAERLDEDAHWNRMLSLGEQQRLGLARALLHRPQFLFLDEATASLDEPSEAAMYRLLAEKLPETTMVSIGSSLDTGGLPPAQGRAGPRRRSIRTRGSDQGRHAVAPELDESAAAMALRLTHRCQP